MKNLNIIASAVIAAAMFATPSMSVAKTDATLDIKFPVKGAAVFADDDGGALAKRGRGRGRGGDDNREDGHGGSNDDNNRDRSNVNSDNNDDSPSGRSRPRIPGGSGCDDPGDVLEHPECRN